MNFIQKNLAIFFTVVGIIAAALALISGLLYKAITPRDAHSYPTPTEVHLYNTPTP